MNSVQAALYIYHAMQNGFHCWAEWHPGIHSHYGPWWEVLCKRGRS